MLLQVLINLYSAHMDPDDWQQPRQFRPERFLDEWGNIIDRDHVIAFSLGIYAPNCHKIIYDALYRVGQKNRTIFER